MLVSRTYRWTLCLALGLACNWLALASAQGPQAGNARPEMAGLKKFQTLVGSWRASSQTSGPRRTGGVEDLRWRWQFAKDEPAALKMTIEDGVYLRGGVLKYDPERDKYLFSAERVIEGAKDKPPEEQVETVIYEGKLEASEEDPNVQVLLLTRRVPGTTQQERVSLRLQEQHHYVFQIDRRNTSKAPFQPLRIFSVTREGESIALLEENKKGPVCIVSGGLGTMSYAYKGVTYSFCCTGCLESFKDDPEKYIAEAKKMGIGK